MSAMRQPPFIGALAITLGLTTVTPSLSITPEEQASLLAREEQARTNRHKRCTEKRDEILSKAKALLQAGNYSGAIKSANPCATSLDDPALNTLIEKATTAKRQAESAHEKASELADKKRKKREGVRIGMSQQEVLASSWGKPTRINKTTTRHGTREQWAYGNRNYLYFVNGTLEIIHN